MYWLQIQYAKDCDMLLARNAGKVAAPDYQRHQPVQTPLYQIIEEYYPEFKARLEANGRTLPRYVQREFEDFLTCGRLEYGLLRVRYEDCKHDRLEAFSCKRRGFCPSCGARRMAESAALLVNEVLPQEPMRQWVLSFPFQLRFLFASYPELMCQVLGIVYRMLSTHLIKKAGFTKTTAQTGSVTLIQRFGSAVNLNIHFHMLFLDGIFAEDPYGQMHFHRVNAPTIGELSTLAHSLSQRIARFLERKRLLEHEAENSYLMLEQSDEDVMAPLHGHSLTYRIAIGSQQGRKVFILQTQPSKNRNPSLERVTKEAGFSLHAGVSAEAHQRDKLEKLCR
ncbi:MAG: hypothetical protein ACJASG_001458 [Oleiphilaceae bacterium]